MENFDYKNKKELILQEALKKEKKSFASFFIRRFRFTYLILITVIILGTYSLLSLPREAEPEIKVPYGIISTFYPGATPINVEEQITNKIEEKIENLENLNQYSSSSGQGFSSIVVEYSAEADLDTSFQKLREAVDEARPNLPKEAESPVVTELNFADMPILTYSLTGDYSDLELKKYADRLKSDLEKINGASKVDIVGGVEREFKIIIDQTKMASYNISVSQVANSVQMNNFSLPAGDIEIDGFKYNIRVSGSLKDIEELQNLVVATYNNSPVYLVDFAEVKDDFREKETESKIGFRDGDSRQAISLQIYKKTGGNILQIVESAENTVKDFYEKGDLPKNLLIVKTNDNSTFIKEDLKTLGTSGIQTVILITLILLLILSFRGALITAIAVPLSFLMTFVFLYLQGMTLNSMVLFSLVLSLGLMVDNAIVIIEGINEFVSEHKKTVFEAAILSAWNFRWAIIAGTMTTVSAFLPMLLVSGILGEYLSILPKTISVTLLSSLFVALVVIPTLAARFIKIKKIDGLQVGHRNKRRHIFIAEKFKKIHGFYSNFLRKVLPSKRARLGIIASAFVLFFISLAVPFSGLMKIQMFPDIDMEYFAINIELPAGSNLEKTKEIVLQAENLVSRIPELDNYVVKIGQSSSVGYGDGDSLAANLGSITVNLVDKKERKRTSYQIAESVRSDFSGIQGAQILVEELQAGPPTGAPIEVRIFGEDLKQLSETTEFISKYFKDQPDVINIKNNIEESAGEFVFSVDRQKADYYGLSVSSIASALRSTVYGSTVSTADINGDDVDIIIKYDKDNLKSLSALEDLLFFSSNGQKVFLKQVASVEFEPALLNIRHRDGSRVAIVNADIKKGSNLQAILAKFEKDKETMPIPEDFIIKVGGEVEDIEKSYRETFLSMIVAIIMIAMILVLQFNSFKQPFIILFSLPLAIIGVIIGLNIFREPFGFPVFIGLVSLAGIVVNDAIVLIDRINKNIRQGLEFNESIIEAGIARMQPVFLTSITTIAGILPLVYANELWRGLSLTVIFGLIFSTVLVLFMVPIFYASICLKEKREMEDE